MHGLINRALQCFLRDTYGEPLWRQLMTDLDLGFSEFEAVLFYEDTITQKVIDGACKALAKDRDEFLEDLGTYLVSHTNVEALRRLMRFGGVTFEDFLWSLDDLPDRAALAVPDLRIPKLVVIPEAEGRFLVRCANDYPGFSHVLVGILRTMADDYGALVFIEHGGTQGDDEVVSVTLLESAFSEGRSFELARQVG